MSGEYRRYVRSRLSAADETEAREASLIAAQFSIELAVVHEEIDRLHVHNAESQEVQSVVERLLEEQLDFQREQLLNAGDGFLSRLRPDFEFRLPSGGGVLVEVERGGTTTNNHDLKDIWKAHLAQEVRHLFLVVPNTNWNKAGVARERPFPRVVTRMQSFFGNPRIEIDVISLHVFGYGK